MENTHYIQVNHFKGIIESLLFVSERPVTLEQIKNVVETINVSDIKNLITKAGFINFNIEKVGKLFCVTAFIE